MPTSTKHEGSFGKKFVTKDEPDKPKLGGGVAIQDEPPEIALADWVPDISGACCIFTAITPIITVTNPFYGPLLTVKWATTASHVVTVTGAGMILTGPMVVFTPDGMAAVVNDRVLVKDQTTHSQNGVYSVTTVGVAGTTGWVLTRTADADQQGELQQGTRVSVSSGTVNAGRQFRLNTEPTTGISPVIPGTTLHVWGVI